jgi:hypothetical protein
VPNRLLASTDPRVKAFTIAIYAALHSFTRNNNPICRVSIPTVAKRAHCALSIARRELRNLRDMDFIDYDDTAGGQRERSAHTFTLLGDGPNEYP